MTRNKFHAVCIFACISLMTLHLQSCIKLPGKQLVINEVCGKEFPDNEWVEIYNPTDSVVKLKGLYLIKVDENGIDYELFRFKSGELAPGHVYVISSMKDELRRHISRSKEVGIELVGPDDNTIDSFYRDDEVGEKSHPANGSYARIPNGSGNWVIVTNASRNELNPEDAEIVEQDMFEDTDSDDSGDDEE